jgi:acyl carrier protein
VLALVSEFTRVPRDRITGMAALDGELRMESVTFVELQVAIEDTYQIEIDPIRVVQLNQFDPIIDYIYECVVQVSAPGFR